MTTREAVDAEDSHVVSRLVVERAGLIKHMEFMVPTSVVAWRNIIRNLWLARPSEVDEREYFDAVYDSMADFYVAERERNPDGELIRDIASKSASGEFPPLLHFIGESTDKWVVMQNGVIARTVFPIPKSLADVESSVQ